MAVNTSDTSPVEEHRQSSPFDDSSHETSVIGSHDPRRCAHVKDDGSQCQGMKGASGYCPPHARLLGLLPALPSPRSAAALAPGSSSESRDKQAEALASAQEMAQASLSMRVAAWLAKPSTQRELEKRWDRTVADGSDSDLYRLLKDMLDRTEGRPGEQQKAEPVPDPQSIAEVRAMTSEQRRAFIRRKTEEARGE